MSRPSWLIAVVVVIGVAGTARAGLRETFDHGNEAFAMGNYEEAVRAYEELLELGVWDPDVFYNLGTTYARMDRPGRAILSLERALILDPGHDEALDNLRIVRQTLARRRTEAGEDADLEPPRSFWMNLLNRVTPGQVGVPFIICYVALFVVLGARRLTGRELSRLVLLIVALVLGAAVVIGGGLVMSKAVFDREVREAIAVRDGEATLREGPGERFRQAFTAYEGDRLRVLDRERGWLHLRDSAGQEGWGQSEDFGELRRPE